MIFTMLFSVKNQINLESVSIPMKLIMIASHTVMYNEGFSLRS